VTPAKWGILFFTVMMIVNIILENVFGLVFCGFMLVTCKINELQEVIEKKRRKNY
jgi:hypothetical protein